MGQMLMERLAATEPRLLIDQCLSVLLPATQATSGGVFVVRAEPVLLYSRGVDHESLKRVGDAWVHSGRKLRGGEAVHDGTWCIWPLESPRGKVLLYIGGPKLVELERVRRAVDGLAPVFVAAAHAESMLPAATDEVRRPIDWYLASTPPEVVEREQLMLMLHHDEWNLARLARRLGITRPTLYARMRRLGIKRVRILKTEQRSS